MNCKNCGEPIRPNQTGGWYHPETTEHRSDQQCFLYATPTPVAVTSPQPTEDGHLPAALEYTKAAIEDVASHGKPDSRPDQ